MSHSASERRLDDNQYSSKLPGDERTTVPDSQSRQGKRVPFPESVESGGYTAGKSKRLSKSEFDDLWLDALDALAVAHLVCIDYAANETFQGNFKEYKSTSSLPPTRNDHFIEKVFVARPSGKRAVWKRAGKLPFTHCVINKLFVSAPKATVVIPVHASSVMGSFVRESERTSSSMSLYEALDALRVIAGFYDEKDENLPSVVVIGLHDSSSHSTQKSREKFKRRVREALSIHWPKFETVLCTDDELGEVFERNADWLSWVRREDSEFFWAAQTIFDLYRQDLKFVPPDEIKFKQLSEQLKNLLKYGFITSTECQVRRNDPNPAIHYLINLDDIEYILLDLLEHSETAKMAFKKHGLIPFVAVKEVLDSWAKDSDYQCWLSAFQHFGIFILPANIKCEHLEPDCSYKPIGPREDYRQPASLPDPTDKAFIVPHCLPNKRLPEGDPPGYVRTAAFILRCKEGHRVSECLFYFIGAILIKHYPQSPRCYYRAMRLRVTSGHILEVKLEDDVIYASMLVQTTDNTFQSTGSAKICSLVKEALREDSKVLKGKSHLTRGLQFGAFMETHNLMKDFVDLEDSDGLTVRVFSEEGEEFYPPVSLYLWFNSYGPQGTLIEKHFAELAEQMDAEKVFRHLIKSDRISGDQYRDLVVDDNPPSSRRLLTIIAATCHDCDQLLLDALRSTHQKTLAHKIRPVFQTSTSIPSSASIPPSTSASTTLKRNLDKEEHQTVQGLAAMAKSSCYISQATDSGDDEKNETAINMSVRQKPIYRHTQARGIEEKVMPVRRSREPLFQNVVTSQTSAVSQSAKPDPQPQAIFEAKYYHVERATDYFNERPFREGGKRLGSGSFGTAYHGILHSEQGEKFEVAVKRLKKGFSHTEAQSELYRKQFETEINILSRYIDSNIINLVGFSSDGPELCLIFGYMANGTLSHRLDCKNNTLPLQWKTRLSISVGIASGLNFLHSTYRRPVIHRDVKSSNVLLSATFEAKLSDFGLAVVGESDGTEISVKLPVGTRPYMAPETFQKIITPKVDVYGMGIIFYEVATGLPPFSSKKKQDLKNYVTEIESQGIDLTKMLDPKAKWPKAKEHSFGLRLIAVAKKCSAEEYRERPPAKDIVDELKKLAEKATD